MQISYYFASFIQKYETNTTLFNVTHILSVFSFDVKSIFLFITNFVSLQWIAEKMKFGRTGSMVHFEWDKVTQIYLTQTGTRHPYRDSTFGRWQGCNPDRQGSIARRDRLRRHRRIRQVSISSTFKSTCYIRKCLAQPLSNLSLAFAIFGKRVSAQKLLVKCWWNWLKGCRHHQLRLQERRQGQHVRQSVVVVVVVTVVVVIDKMYMDDVDFNFDFIVAVVIDNMDMGDIDFDAVLLLMI